MGLIEDIQIPDFPRDFSKNENILYYKNNVSPIVKESMEKCKQYYNELQEAIYTVSSYIISYQHTLESLEFSKKQMEKAREKLQEIDDSNFNVVRNHLNYNINRNSVLDRDLNAKILRLRQILDKLNEDSAEVIRKNAILDGYPRY
jgi:DNA repair exonuclease SbcCD ATPase subunit